MLTLLLVPPTFLSREEQYIPGGKAIGAGLLDRTYWELIVPLSAGSAVALSFECYSIASVLAVTVMYAVFAQKPSPAKRQQEAFGSR